MKITLRNGNAIEELKKIPNESVDCVISSPPYYGLRSYKSADIIWGDSKCDHEFLVQNHYSAGQSDKSTTSPKVKGQEMYWSDGYCTKCGAWKGQLGLEPTYQMYIDHLMLIMKELKRVLKKQGRFFGTWVIRMLEIWENDLDVQIQNMLKQMKKELIMA